MERDREGDVDSVGDAPKHKASRVSKVILRVWLTKVGGKVATIAQFFRAHRSKKEGLNVGHVSVSTSLYHASHWPGVMTDDVWKVYPSGSMSQEDDVREEGGEADIVISFYTLNKSRIEAAIRGLWANKPGWTLFGDANTRGAQGRSVATSTLVSRASVTASVAMGSAKAVGVFMMSGEIREDGGKIIKTSGEKKAHSCASMAMYLLEQGGIEHLDRDFTNAMRVSIKTPNNFAVYARALKAKELVHYPETQKWEGADLSAIPKAKEGCTIS